MTCTLVLGGSGSGKSAWAEQWIATLPQKRNRYIATMLPNGREAAQKIARHRKMRENAKFETIECSMDLSTLPDMRDSAVLLESLSNLLANVLYPPEQLSWTKLPAETVEQKVWQDLQQLEQRCGHLVIVSDSVFYDGIVYDAMTACYLEQLGRLHQKLAATADCLVEVVYGIPLIHQCKWNRGK